MHILVIIANFNFKNAVILYTHSHTHTLVCVCVCVCVCVWVREREIEPIIISKNIWIQNSAESTKRKIKLVWIIIKQGWTHKQCSFIDSCTWMSLCWLITKDLLTLALCGHKIQSRGYTPGVIDDRNGGKESQRSLCCQHNLIRMRYIYFCYY